MVEYGRTLSYRHLVTSAGGAYLAGLWRTMLEVVGLLAIAWVIGGGWLLIILRLLLVRVPDEWVSLYVGGFGALTVVVGLFQIGEWV